MIKRNDPPVSMTTAAFAALFVLSFALWGCGGGGTASEPKRTQTTTQQASSAPASNVDPRLLQAGVTELDLKGPHEPPLDQFNPDKTEVKPALGGRVIQHIASEPPNLNFAVENSAVIRWIHREVHAGLLEFDLAMWTYDPVLAKSFDLEDTVILKGGRGEDNSNIVYGVVSEEGDEYVVKSGSQANGMSERRIPMADVEAVERGTVFTFHLRDDVTWHDGEKFDAEDVHFSWQLYSNPHVDCDEKRSTFELIVHGEIVDPQTVRFFYKQQYFAAVRAFTLDFCLLPSHLFNIKDPTNKDYNPNASDSDAGTYINDNPHNLDWVGLGPYKLTTWERGRYLEAEKYDGYFDPDPRNSGYVDVLRWTHVDDDNLALQALLNGEVDIFDRVKSEDFFGAATKQDVFVNSFYKAITYTGNLGYIGWNLYRPHLSDVRVRKALAHAFDVHEWIRTNYKGRALPATSSQFRFGPGYNKSVEVLPYSVEKAEELLADAGWYDRDGNQIVDKDGQDLEIEVLMPSGNKASEKLLQKVQESYEKIGVRLTIQQLEWATFLERILDRDFDACNLAWVLGDVESDPFGLWHGDEAALDRRTSNHSGLNIPAINDLIDQGRRELDPAKRHATWQQIHQRVYEEHPYLFGWNVPRKIAFSKKLRGVKLYKFAPGYRLRDMYFEEGTPGTRPFVSQS